jgi:CRISPR-associated endonuclease Cas3-HD
VASASQPSRLLACFQPEAPLPEHLAAVAAVAVEAFRRRLTSGPMRLLDGHVGVRGSGAAAAALAGVLHDIGKASPYYQSRRRGFYGHELASAALMVEASRLLRTGGGPGYLMLLAAYAVARHHAAVRVRHPVYLASHNPRDDLARSLLREAGAALCSLAAEPGVLHEALPCGLASTPLGGLLRSALEAVGGKCERHGGVGVVLEAARVTGSLEGLVPSPAARGLAPLAWAASLSGALIVADILVASAQRREAGGSGDPEEALKEAYKRSWAREVPEAWKLAKRYAWGGACTVVVGVLEPLQASLRSPPRAGGLGS